MSIILFSIYIKPFQTFLRVSAHSDMCPMSFATVIPASLSPSSLSLIMLGQKVVFLKPFSKNIKMLVFVVKLPLTQLNPRE